MDTLGLHTQEHTQRQTNAQLHQETSTLDQVLRAHPASFLGREANLQTETDTHTGVHWHWQPGRQAQACTDSYRDVTDVHTKDQGCGEDEAKTDRQQPGGRNLGASGAERRKAARGRSGQALGVKAPPRSQAHGLTQEWVGAVGPPGLRCPGQMLITRVLTIWSPDPPHLSFFSYHLREPSSLSSHTHTCTHPHPPLPLSCLCPCISPSLYLLFLSVYIASAPGSAHLFPISVLGLLCHSCQVRSFRGLPPGRPSPGYSWRAERGW